MILNNSKTNSCFSAIDPSGPYENYPAKKTFIEKSFWFQPPACGSIHQLQK